MQTNEVVSSQKYLADWYTCLGMDFVLSDQNSERSPKKFVHGQKIGRKLVKKGKGRNCKEGQVRFKLRSGLRNGGQEIEDESTALESSMRGPAKMITPL